MVPCIAFTSSWTIAIPRPVPLYFVRAVLCSCVKGLYRLFSIKSRLIPIPSSCTFISKTVLFSLFPSISETIVCTCPFSLEYLIALLRRLSSILRKCITLSMRKRCWTWSSRMIKSMFPSCSLPITIACTFSNSSSREKATCSNSISLLSSLLISRTSLSIDWRWPDAISILSKHSLIRCGFVIFFRMIPDIPTIPFNGVRTSWDIWERNSDFARLARSAFTLESSRFFW